MTPEGPLTYQSTPLQRRVCLVFISKHYKTVEIVVGDMPPPARGTVLKEDRGSPETTPPFCIQSVFKY